MCFCTFLFSVVETKRKSDPILYFPNHILSTSLVSGCAGSTTLTSDGTKNKRFIHIWMLKAFNALKVIILHHVWAHFHFCIRLRLVFVILSQAGFSSGGIDEFCLEIHTCRNSSTLLLYLFRLLWLSYYVDEVGRLFNFTNVFITKIINRQMLKLANALL